MPHYTYVEQPDRIAPLFDGVDAVGVDTEFMRERTFFSQLCLVQVAAAGEIYCVDPLGGQDLDAFWAALMTPHWVAHSARQDIEVLYQTARRMPQSLFDTQIAAGLLGFQPQLGYAGLVQELFGVELPKSHTRANWAARPLPAEYLEYAAEDVEYLLPARDRLGEMLDARGRLDWALADSALLLDPALHDIDPTAAIQRLKGARNFRGARRAAAERLAAWREEQALSRNLPRQWIMKDNVLTDIAYRLPATRADLEGIDGVPPKLVQRAGGELLDAVAAARKDGPTTEPQPARRGPPDEQQKTLLKAMHDLVAECAGDLGVAAETIASKKELAAVVVDGNRDSRVFSGWRRELVGERLYAMLPA